MNDGSVVIYSILYHIISYHHPHSQLPDSFLLSNFYDSLCRIFRFPIFSPPLYTHIWTSTPPQHFFMFQIHDPPTSLRPNVSAYKRKASLSLLQIFHILFYRYHSKLVTWSLVTLRFPFIQLISHHHALFRINHLRTFRIRNPGFLCIFFGDGGWSSSSQNKTNCV